MTNLALTISIVSNFYFPTALMENRNMIEPQFVQETCMSSANNTASSAVVLKCEKNGKTYFKSIIR